MPPHVVQNIVEMVIVSVSMLSFAGILSWTVLRFRQPRPGGASSPQLAELTERLARLEQAVDAVAVEVERSGEAQRFTARLLADRLEEGAMPRAVDRGAVDRAIAPHRPTRTPH